MLIYIGIKTNLLFLKNHNNKEVVPRSRLFKNLNFKLPRIIYKIYSRLIRN
jgi:hypothetical protein